MDQDTRKTLNGLVRQLSFTRKRDIEYVRALKESDGHPAELADGNARIERLDRYIAALHSVLLENST